MSCLTSSNVVLTGSVKPSQKKNALRITQGDDARKLTGLQSKDFLLDEWLTTVASNRRNATLDRFAGRVNRVLFGELTEVFDGWILTSHFPDLLSLAEIRQDNRRGNEHVDHSSQQSTFQVILSDFDFTG